MLQKKSETFHKVPLSIGISFLRYKKDCVVLIVTRKISAFCSFLQGGKSCFATPFLLLVGKWFKSVMCRFALSCLFSCLFCFYFNLLFCLLYAVFVFVLSFCCKLLWFLFACAYNLKVVYKRVWFGFYCGNRRELSP